MEPTIQFFVIVPAENAEEYKCEIPIKGDVTNYTQFISNSYQMLVHGLLEYEGKSLLFASFDGTFYNYNLLNTDGNYRGTYQSKTQLH